MQYSHNELLARVGDAQDALGADEDAKVRDTFRRDRLARVDEQELVAAHEAAHALMARRFGHEVRLVSIRPSDRYRGFCVHKAPEVEGAAARVTGSVPALSPRKWRTRNLPVVLVPYDVRADIESHILIAFAGRAGEELWLQLGRFRGHRRVPDDPDVAAAMKTLRDVSSAPPRHEPRPKCESELSDLEEAWRLASLMVAEEEVAAYLAWLEVSARRLTREPVFVKCLQALVPVLVRHEELSGSSLREIADRAAADHSRKESHSDE
jgi:hypothetical protein